MMKKLESLEVEHNLLKVRDGIINDTAPTQVSDRPIISNEFKFPIHPPQTQVLLLFIGGNGQCTQLYNPLMNSRKVPQSSYAESL